jgi:hypothetical protein
LRVIEHTPELLVTYVAEGTVVSVPMLADGRGLRDVPLDERWSHPRTSLRRPWHGTAIRAEGERVWNERPWPTGWEDWPVQTEWTTPERAAGWND